MMKKWIALTLSAMLALSVLTACGGGKDEPNQPETDSVTDENGTSGAVDVVPDDNLDEKDEEGTPEEPETPTEQMPTDEGSDGEAAPSPDEIPAEPELDAVIEAIYAVKDTGLSSMMTTALDLSDADSVAYFTGLTDVSKIAGISVSEPMIGSQAYSLILARVNDPADAESVAREIMENIDPAKWICVSADDMAAAVSGDLVLFVMIDSNFEDKNASDFTDAFLSLYGGSAVSK